MRTVVPCGRAVHHDRRRAPKRRDSACEAYAAAAMSVAFYCLVEASKMRASSSSGIPRPWSRHAEHRPFLAVVLARTRIDRYGAASGLNLIALSTKFAMTLSMLLRSHSPSARRRWLPLGVAVGDGLHGGQSSCATCARSLELDSSWRATVHLRRASSRFHRHRCRPHRGAPDRRQHLCKDGRIWHRTRPARCVARVVARSPAITVSGLFMSCETARGTRPSGRPFP